MSLIVIISFLLAVYCQNDCLSDPTQEMCVDYSYPDVNATVDISNLCTAMSFMPGCTINSVCSESHTNDPYCQPFSVLADVCAEDMPLMKGCMSYVALCGVEGTQVGQCSEQGPIPGIPTTEEANNAIRSVCQSHFMSSCTKCPDSGSGIMQCDLLSVYSELCLQMPDMPECAQWKVMCAEDSIAHWEQFCPSNSQPPIMRMYFHTGILDYILFEKWVPRTTAQYVGSIFAVFFFAIFFEALQTARSYYEWKWNSELEGILSEKDALVQDSQYVWGQAPFRPWIDFKKSVLHSVETILSYCLMLIAMTFNVGLFLGVIAGFFVGHFLFGRFRIYIAKPSCCT